jgi:phosphatidate phosphatase APP1
VRILLVALLALPALARADGAVLLFPAIGSLTKVTLTGRVFKDEAHGSTTLSKNVRRLTASNWEGAAVEVRYAGQSKNVVSGHDGNFEAVFEQVPPKTFAISNQKAEARVSGAKVGVASVEIVPPTAPFFVVSDFDDTVAVSEVLSKRRLLANALLKDETTQSVVPGMSAFYACLRDNPDKPSFALVSGSPVQFAPRIGAFLSNHRFPPMGLYLRDLGAGTLTDYKQPLIRGLLRGLPNKAVLIGDSGEHDPEVYRQMIEEFPGRVVRAYIRNAGRTEDKARFEGLMLFDEPKQAALDAVAKGLASKACVDEAFP